MNPADDAPFDDAHLDACEQRIDAWVNAEAEANPVVASVERGEPGERRWYVRIHGETKDVYAVWFTLRQRSLHYETYVMPAPEEDHAAFYEHLLRRNRRLVGVQFCIGEEDAVFLAGSIPLEALDERALDRALGAVYAAVELCFQPALRIGFATRFRERP